MQDEYFFPSTRTATPDPFWVQYLGWTPNPRWRLRKDWRYNSCWHSGIIQSEFESSFQRPRRIRDFIVGGEHDHMLRYFMELENDLRFELENIFTHYRREKDDPLIYTRDEYERTDTLTDFARSYVQLGLMDFVQGLVLPWFGQWETALTMSIDGKPPLIDTEDVRSVLRSIFNILSLVFVHIFEGTFVLKKREQGETQESLHGTNYWKLGAKFSSILYEQKLPQKEVLNFLQGLEMTLSNMSEFPHKAMKAEA